MHGTAPVALGGVELVAEGIVDDGGNQLAVLVRGGSGGSMLKAHGDAELRRGVGEVGGAVERVDVPAVFGVEALAGTFFAEDAVGREDLGEAGADEGFAGAVCDCDQIGVALVLGFNTLGVKIAEDGSGFAGDQPGFRGPLE